jgi:two-component system sensor histidine kinase KdpD
VSRPTVVGRSGGGYVVALAAVAVVTAVGLAAFPYVGALDVAMLYLLAIMIAAVRGRGPALVAAASSVAAFDVCFVPPRFTFVVNDPRHLITFGVMFAIGIAISTLTERLRRQAAEVRDATLRAGAEELRSSILSVVSHDFRTPLAVVIGAATTLRDRDERLGVAARHELVDTIAEEAVRLERVLGNILNMTRVEAGLVPAREWVPVEELVGSALTRLESALAGRTVDVVLEPELAVAVDPVLFELVLVNLLDNAVKHGAPPIRILAARTDAIVEIDVEDAGPGMPEGSEGRIFDKFSRASGAPGVGLGLAIVRGIVEAHGGAVSAARRRTGGARFRVRLPPAVMPPAAGEAAGEGEGEGEATA